MRYQMKRWHGVAALGAAGVLVLPAVASADDDAEAGEVVDQYVIVDVDILQQAASNTGLNEQINAVLQGNDTVQDADASADSGDADAVTDGTLEEAVADALAGFGGDAASTNDATSTNDSTGDNSLTTGAAAASNTLSGSVTQNQSSIADNLAVAVDDGDAAAGALVLQGAEAKIWIGQSASANSGYNSQVNITAQGNVTDQVSTSSANGGSASAGSGSESISTAGDGGIATSGNTSSSSNTSSGGNSVSTGNASSSNSTSFSVTQTNSSDVINTAEGGG